MSRRLYTTTRPPHRWHRPNPVHVVEPDGGQYRHLYGDRPPLESVKARMQKLGMKGEPIESVLLKISRRTQRGYWLHVYVGVIEANAIRILAKRGRGVYSPASFVTTSFRYV